MSDILFYLTSQQEEMVALLKSWVNQDSPTSDKYLSDQMGQEISEAFIKIGSDRVIHSQPDCGDHYTLTWQYPSALGQILLSGHFDTVWPAETAANRPFQVNQGKALGPGVSDMKAGLVIAYFAMKALQELNLRPLKNIVLVLNSDEEIGSLTSRPVIEAEARQSDACLVLEPAINGALTTWRKGVGRFRLNITGVASHSGVDPEKGASAVTELAHQILTLDEMSDFHQGTIINVSPIRGGLRPNVVAAKASAEIDLRIKSVQEAERLVEAITNLQPRNSRTTISVSGGLIRPPFQKTDAGLDLAKKTQSIARRLGFRVDLTGSGGASDANFTSALGVPTLDGLGGVGGGSHSESEYTLVEFLPKRAALLAELILSLGQA